MKQTATAIAKASAKAKQADESERIGREAVAASEKLRARFDAEREALSRRFGVFRGLN
ncbi:MAG TPA: hypothetical protein VFF00_06815 [Candidatus Elarobacter sp.]|nr:hypothetical protein [Dongiaceae bacterium]HZW53727.1 hypothetical protein [Candidatus Elarobacter sp.]